MPPIGSPEISKARLFSHTFATTSERFQSGDVGNSFIGNISNTTVSQSQHQQEHFQMTSIVVARTRLVANRDYGEIEYQNAAIAQRTLPKTNEPVTTRRSWNSIDADDPLSSLLSSEEEEKGKTRFATSAPMSSQTALLSTMTKSVPRMGNSIC